MGVQRRRTRRIALAALLSCFALSAPFSAQAQQTGALCAEQTAKHERLNGIPKHLLDAISIVESGRWDSERRASIAWPWTVMAEGKGRFLPTKEAAIAEVRALKAKGVRNIDVGCMQINLHYHPDAFDNLEEAFDPAHNVAYAARFLKNLHASTGHWPTAASYYHSQTPELAARYREKLMAAWDAVTNTPGTFAALSAPPAETRIDPMLARIQEQRRLAAQQREERQRQLAADREETRKIAEAYRKARLAEYMLRKQERAARLEVKG
ncbi:transglycosylase SLT domain-containing protein [Telmatospirillum sp. J64-1]|uniref:transglycosylase SLT domain-containing protein n=1 Tax=Telmatospirillum sp. J64-1 TaxID=2502183 RepID=UPI00115EA1D4|nr:transglycosylase SLT domain-containing protein [Telmatospirillum sp. J64-1]